MVPLSTATLMVLHSSALLPVTNRSCLLGSIVLSVWTLKSYSNLTSFYFPSLSDYTVIIPLFCVGETIPFMWGVQCIVVATVMLFLVACLGIFCGYLLTIWLTNLFFLFAHFVHWNVAIFYPYCSAVGSQSLIFDCKDRTLRLSFSSQDFAFWSTARSPLLPSLLSVLDVAHLLPLFSSLLSFCLLLYSWRHWALSIFITTCGFFFKVNKKVSITLLHPIKEIICLQLQYYVMCFTV